MDFAVFCTHIQMELHWKHLLVLLFSTRYSWALLDSIALENSSRSSGYLRWEDVLFATWLAFSKSSKEKSAIQRFHHHQGRFLTISLWLMMRRGEVLLKTVCHIRPRQKNKSQSRLNYSNWPQIREYHWRSSGAIRIYQGRYLVHFLIGNRQW